MSESKSRPPAPPPRPQLAPYRSTRGLDLRGVVDSKSAPAAGKFVWRPRER